MIRCPHAATPHHPRPPPLIRRRRVLLGRTGLWRRRTGPSPVDLPHHLLDGRIPQEVLTGEGAQDRPRACSSRHAAPEADQDWRGGEGERAAHRAVLPRKLSLEASSGTRQRTASARSSRKTRINNRVQRNLPGSKSVSTRCETVEVEARPSRHPVDARRTSLGLRKPYTGLTFLLPAAIRADLLSV